MVATRRVMYGQNINENNFSIEPDKIPYPMDPVFNTGYKPGEEIPQTEQELATDWNIFKTFIYTILIVTVVLALMGECTPLSPFADACSYLR